MRSSLGVCLLAVLLATVSGCEALNVEGEICSSPGVSESDYAGDSDCAPDLICAPDRVSASGAPSVTVPSGEARCRALCERTVECPDGFACRGVSGAEARSACFPVAAD